jgi:hypothetical protein
MWPRGTLHVEEDDGVGVVPVHQGSGDGEGRVDAATSSAVSAASRCAIATAPREG